MRFRSVLCAVIAQTMTACAGHTASFSTGVGAERPAGPGSGQSCLVDSDCSHAGELCQLNSCVAREQPKEAPRTTTPPTPPQQAAPDVSQPCLTDSDCSRAGWVCQLNACTPRTHGENAPSRAEAGPRVPAEMAQPCVSDSDCSQAGSVCQLNACVRR